MKEKKYYYQVQLELWRRNTEKLFGSINISHIPYEKFKEMFKDQFSRERFVFDDVSGYEIDEELYQKYKDYLDHEVPVKFDFSLFEYWVGLSGVEIHKYQKDYYDELPKPFKK